MCTFLGVYRIMWLLLLKLTVSFKQFKNSNRFCSF